MRKFAISLAVILGTVAGLFIAANKVNLNPLHSAGEILDAYNGVPVYYNGSISHVSERNIAPDGYNIGLKYQCVEFVKRYYYERFRHKMPQDRGNAKDFFNPKLQNGAVNAERGLVQFINGAGEKPVEEDLVVFAPWIFNWFGHVAIVSEVGSDHVELIQQNPGPFGASRERYKLVVKNGKLRIDSSRLMGWLRWRESPAPSFSPDALKRTS
jgi:hypothetical protein